MTVYGTLLLARELGVSITPAEDDIAVELSPSELVSPELRQAVQQHINEVWASARLIEKGEPVL